MADTTTPTPWPSREQLLGALRAAASDPDVPIGWCGVLARLLTKGRYQAELRAALRRLTDRTVGADETPDEITHAELADNAALRLGYYQGLGALERSCDREAFIYAHLAQAALDTFAAGITPVWFDSPLEGEHRTHRRGCASGCGCGEQNVIDTPEPTLPDALVAAEGTYLIRCALRQLEDAVEAGREYEEMGEYENDEGDIGHCIPEHMLGDAEQLYDEARRWHDYVGDFADAVAYTLATTWLPRLTAAARIDGGVADRG